MFLAIAVDNLANAQELTAAEEQAAEQREKVNVHISHDPLLLGRPERQFRTSLYFAADVFFGFAKRSPRSLDRSPWNFATWSETGWIL